VSPPPPTSFLQAYGKENSYFIPQISLLEEGKNPDLFNFTSFLWKRLRKDGFSGGKQFLYTLKECKSFTKNVLA
jgi:hypothetical protein